MSAKKRWAFTKAALLERDGPNCCWCGVETRTDVDGHHPQYRTLEHVLSQARGGKTTLENCKLACQKCNNEREGIDANGKRKIVWPDHGRWRVSPAKTMRSVEECGMLFGLE